MIAQAKSGRLRRLLFQSSQTEKRASAKISSSVVSECVRFRLLCRKNGPSRVLSLVDPMRWELLISQLIAQSWERSGLADWSTTKLPQNADVHTCLCLFYLQESNRVSRKSCCTKAIDRSLLGNSPDKREDWRANLDSCSNCCSNCCRNPRSSDVSHPGKRCRMLWRRTLRSWLADAYVARLAGSLYL